MHASMHMRNYALSFCQRRLHMFSINGALVFLRPLCHIRDLQSSDGCCGLARQDAKYGNSQVLLVHMYGRKRAACVPCAGGNCMMTVCGKYQLPLFGRFGFSVKSCMLYAARPGIGSHIHPAGATIPSSPSSFDEVLHSIFRSFQSMCFHPSHS